MRSALALTVLSAIVFHHEADAHWSASRGGSLYTHRYLICAGGRGSDRPHDRVRCAGPIRARARLLAALDGKDDSRTHDAAVEAVYYNVRDAVPALRKLLAHAPTAQDRTEHRGLQLNGYRGEAAYALAHLGDAASAPAIADLVRELETQGHGTLWRDTLEALAHLDPARASRYAIDFMSRASDFYTSLPGGGSKLAALDVIRRDDAAAALPILDRLAKAEEHNSRDHAHCELMATRVRLDDGLRAKVRAMFVGSYSGTWLAGCANAVFARLGRPADPDDAAALVRHLGRDDNGMDYGMANLAYQRVLDVLVLGGTAAARETFRKGLAERDRWPHVADPSHRNFSLHYVAMHRAAQAGLGDAAARAKLYALVDDPAEGTGAAWIGAYWALRLGLPDAADHAAALMLRGVATRNSIANGLYDNIRGRVLDAFAERFPSDSRWTVALLDGDTRMLSTPSRATEQALYAISRRAPAGTCDAVTAAARHARVETAEHAFLALTVLGDACRPALARTFEDTAYPSEVRGAALEILGALDDPQLATRIKRAEATGVWRPAIERARLWLAPAGGSLPRGDQPLPPRVHRQGL